jgi:hypothetical protein
MVMNISKESLDSRVLRWSGFAMAGFLAAALTLGSGGQAPAARRQLSEVSTTTVRLGQLAPATAVTCGDRC